MSSISVTPPPNGSVRINDLKIDNEETVNIMSDVEEKDLEGYLINSINIGASVLRNRSTTEKVDYVEKEFSKLMNSLKEKTNEWEEFITESLNESLDPENEGKPVYRLKASILRELTNLRDEIKKEENILEESERGTAKGRVFEAETVSNLTTWQKYPDSFEGTGDSIEGQTGRKVGDILATMENDLTIAMEAKAGSNYSEKGDKSLDRQMNNAMAIRGAQGAIAITTIDAMKEKTWQNSIFLDRGKNRFIVAVDRKRGDFTILRLAYMLLRERIMAESKSVLPETRSISAKKLSEITKDIVRDMSSATKLRQIMTDVEKKINAMRDEISVYQGNIQSRIDELNALI